MCVEGLRVALGRARDPVHTQNSTSRFAHRRAQQYPPSHPLPLYFDAGRNTATLTENNLRMIFLFGSAYGAGHCFFEWIPSLGRSLFMQDVQILVVTCNADCMRRSRERERRIQVAVGSNTTQDARVFMHAGKEVVDGLGALPSMRVSRFPFEVVGLRCVRQTTFRVDAANAKFINIEVVNENALANESVGYATQTRNNPFPHLRFTLCC